MGFYSGGQPDLSEQNIIIKELKEEIKKLKKQNQKTFYLGLIIGSAVTIFVALYI